MNEIAQGFRGLLRRWVVVATEGEGRGGDGRPQSSPSAADPSLAPADPSRTTSPVPFGPIDERVAAITARMDAQLDRLTDPGWAAWLMRAGERAALLVEGRDLRLSLRGSTVLTTDQVLFRAELWLGRVADLMRPARLLAACSGFFLFLLRLVLIAVMVAGLFWALNALQPGGALTSVFSLASLFETPAQSDKFRLLFPQVMLMCLVAACLYGAVALIFMRIRLGLFFALATYISTLPVALGLSLYHTALRAQANVVPTANVGGVFSGVGWLARQFNQMMDSSVSDLYLLAFALTFTLPVSLVVLFKILTAAANEVRRYYAGDRPRAVTRWVMALLQTGVTLALAFGVARLLWSLLGG